MSAPDENTIGAAIFRVRAWATAQGWRKSRLAKEAGFDDTTLRDFWSANWNPRADTLRRLERIIPEDWQVGVAAQEEAEADYAMNGAVPPPDAITMEERNRAFGLGSAYMYSASISDRIAHAEQLLAWLTPLTKSQRERLTGLFPHFGYHSFSTVGDFRNAVEELADWLEAA